MKKFKKILAATLVVFIANITVPFFYSNHFTQASAAIDSQNNTIETKKVLICTTEGFKWIDLETANNSSTNHSSKKDTNTCPSCYIASKVISDLSDFNRVSIILPNQIQNINYYEFDHQVYHQVNQLSSYSRAPPFQV